MEHAGQTSAIVATGRRDLGRRLTQLLGRIGYRAETADDLDGLEGCADSRPALVIVDLALEPSAARWTALVGRFPHAIRWAMVVDEASQAGALSTALKNGCDDYLPLRAPDRELADRLEASVRGRRADTDRAGPGGLDRHMSTEVTLDVPSDYALVEEIVRLVSDRCRDYRAYERRTLVNLRIALAEALSNAIRYGNDDDPSKKVRVRARLDSRSIVVEVTDEGTGFDPHRVPDPTEPEAVESPGGRGLFLLRNLADEVRFNERGNSVTFVLRAGAEGD